MHRVVRVAPDCLVSHTAPYIMLKSDYDINYLVLVHNETEVCKQSSEAGVDEPGIVENLCMFFLGHVHLWFYTKYERKYM